MTPSASSVPEGVLVGTPESGYLWTCGMCSGLRLVEEEGKLTDCPKARRRTSLVLRSSSLGAT
jgi:hypothetical protein